MSSMSDLVFLLLIFFLVTSTLVNPNALKLLLPKSTGQVSAKATVSVSIKDWGDDIYTYHVNGNEEPVSYETVEDELVELLQSEEDPTFSIYSDESVPVKEIVAMMNIDVVDLGVPVLSMHAPWEVTSKLDLYNTYLAFRAFYEEN